MHAGQHAHLGHGPTGGAVQNAAALGIERLVVETRADDVDRTDDRHLGETEMTWQRK